MGDELKIGKPPAWMLGSVLPSEPKSEKKGVPPPPVPAHWAAAQTGTPLIEPPTATPAFEAPPQMAQTQTQQLPDMAADASETAAGIDAMLKAWAAREPDAREFTSRRRVILALARRASGLNRRFDVTIPGLDRYGLKIHLYGTFAMNEVWADARLTDARLFWGQSIRWSTEMPVGARPPQTAAAKTHLRLISLLYPDQLYVTTSLLRAARAFVIARQPLTAVADRQLLAQLWSFWRFSSNEAHNHIADAERDPTLLTALQDVEKFL